MNTEKSWHAKIYDNASVTYYWFHLFGPDSNEQDHVKHLLALFLELFIVQLTETLKATNSRPFLQDLTSHQGRQLAMLIIDLLLGKIPMVSSPALSFRLNGLPACKAPCSTLDILPGVYALPHHNTRNRDCIPILHALSCHPCAGQALG
jgi:hypothetical protein